MTSLNSKLLKVDMKTRREIEVLIIIFSLVKDRLRERNPNKNHPTSTKEMKIYDEFTTGSFDCIGVNLGKN